MKSWLQDTHLEIYSTHSEGKSVLAERFIETFRKKSINITVLLQNLYIDKLAGIVNNYNNTYQYEAC